MTSWIFPFTLSISHGSFEISLNCQHIQIFQTVFNNCNILSGVIPPIVMITLILFSFILITTSFSVTSRLTSVPLAIRTGKRCQCHQHTPLFFGTQIVSTILVLARSFTITSLSSEFENLGSSTIFCLKSVPIGKWDSQHINPHLNYRRSASFLLDGLVSLHCRIVASFFVV